MEIDKQVDEYLHRLYRERQTDSAEIVFSFKLAREGEINFCVIIIIFFIVLLVNIERVYQFIGRLDSGLSIVDQLQVDCDRETILLMIGHLSVGG